MAKIYRKNKVLMILPSDYKLVNGEISVPKHKLMHMKRSSDIVLNKIPVHHLILYIPKQNDQSYSWYIYYGQLFRNGTEPKQQPSSTSDLKIIFYKDLEKDEKKAWDSYFPKIQTLTDTSKSQGNFLQKIFSKIKSHFNIGRHKGSNDIKMECIK